MVEHEEILEMIKTSALMLVVISTIKLFTGINATMVYNRDSLLQ